ncbi:response regulator [uncultured Clostridium sp.]|uniref:response regulator transcription factor n=1 Tax=uncultured Clostridium sp. TaxID=59620 RepID=UPI002600996E|nr:response regulator [uncultured Clostridium sp.]
MNLYKIMLVDDEEEVRKSIINKIDWADTGFEVIGDAENGKDALEKIEQNEPDLVLTDIKMPYMDGLTMAETIRQQYPSVKIVIFSGFDEFEYAKKAIKLNVIEYILKPVNVEELTAILKKIKKNLDEEIEQKRNVNLLRESYIKNLPTIREHFLNDLIHGGMSGETISEKLKEYDIDIDNAHKWIVAAIHLEPDEKVDKAVSLHKERELIPISVQNMIEEKLEGQYRYTMFHSSFESILIAAIDENNSQTGLVAMLGDICKETKKILEVSVTIGVGESSNSLTDIGQSFHSALNALGYRAVAGSGGLIYIRDVEPFNHGKLQFDSRMESELIAAVKFGPEEKIRSVVGDVVGKMEEAKVHYRQYQAYILAVINALTQLSQQYDLRISDMFGVETDYFEILLKVEKTDNIRQYLTEVAFKMNRVMEEERSNTTKNVIQEAKQYIQENFRDPDLSVEKICRHLHMSPAYFSTVFKKETGQAYIAYLTDVRLNRAVELLMTTEDKTYIIADKVGYPEQNYFSYVFKKKFGVSPTKFRGAR